MKKDNNPEFPILDISEDGTIVSRRGDWTIAFEIECPEIFTLSRQDYSALHGRIYTAFRKISRNILIHRQDIYFFDDYIPSEPKSTEKSFLERSRDKFLEGRRILHQKSYLYFTLHHAMPDICNHLDFILGRECFSGFSFEEAEITSFRELVTEITDCLAGQKMFSIRKLGYSDLCSEQGPILLHATLCGNEKFLSDISAKGNGSLHFPDHTVRMLQYPACRDEQYSISPSVRYDLLSTDESEVHISRFSHIGPLLGKEHIVNTYIFGCDTKHETETLEERARQIRSFSMGRARAQYRAGRIDEIVKYVTESDTPLCRVLMNVITWDRKGDDSSYKTTGRAFLESGVTPEKVSGNLLHMFSASYPGCGGYLPAECTTLWPLTSACCLIGTDREHRSHSSSLFAIPLLARATLAPISVDLSDEPLSNHIITNRNKFILGPSGSGKSFFTNNLAGSYYDGGAHIVIIDIGHSYRNLTRLIYETSHGRDGKYITYSMENPLSFNPFHTTTGEYSESRREFLRSLVITLWKGESGSATPSEEGAMMSLIDEFLKGRGTRTTIFQDFYEFVKSRAGACITTGPVTARLHQSTTLNMEEIRSALFPYSREGMYSRVLNSNQEEDLLDNRFIVFELGSIADNKSLMPIVTLVIAQTFREKTEKLPGRRKVIVIEEAWKAISRTTMAEYVRNLFKTIRKQNGEAIVVTQEIDDIVDSPIVKETIITNSDCRILLDQRKFLNRFDKLASLLSITKSEKDQILSINRNMLPGHQYREVWISLGGNCSNVFALEVSDEEYLLYTTEASEKEHVEKALKDSPYGIQDVLVRMGRQRKELRL